jgi:hypothetical protein
MRNKILFSITTVRNVTRTLLIGVLILATASIVLAQSLSPAMLIQPNTRVEVGEEVLFSATGTTYPNATILNNARYEWDFGDGYYHRYDPAVTSITRQGIAVTHYYMKPGAFRVTLKVSLWTQWQPGYASPIGDPFIVETTTQVIHVTGEAPMAGFEIQRAPFQNRLAQYLYVQIPQAYRGNQTTLRVTLEGAKGSSSVLLSKNKLAAEEKVLLNHMPLVQDDYVVIAELMDAKRGRIPGGLWRDKFSKRYDGIPEVGIDENNAFRVNGELFFPIASWMTDYGNIPLYLDRANINSLNTEGYDVTHSPATWGKYLDYAAKYNIMTSGPGRGDYNAGNMGRFNFNIDRMAEYIRLNKDKPMVFGWNWQDEPNMGGRSEKVYMPTLAAWAYVGHREDPQHPSFNLFMGNDWSKYYGTSPSFYGYDYLASAPFFGGKKWMQDIFAFDIYPIASRLHPSLNFVDMGPYAAYLDALDRIHANNKNLVPVIPALQPCRGAAVQAWPSVTEEQVYMETWINVIHGVKGIFWFPYFDMAGSARYTAMQKFADQMKVLAPVVLQPAPVRKVRDNANVALKRVDTLIREKDGSVYVFAARVTEPDPIPVVKYQGVEPESIRVNFTVSGLVRYVTAEVVDEGRRVFLINGQFTDTFDKHAVHIYKINTH